MLSRILICFLILDLQKDIKKHPRLNKRKKNTFFFKVCKNFSDTVNNTDSTLSITTQDSTNDKYFKLYKINSELVNEGIDILKNTINFTHTDDEFFGFDMSVYETLKSGYNDKYEYIYPDLTFDKNLLTNSSIGSINYDANLKIHTYDTNKTSKIFVNNFNWNSVEKDLILEFRLVFLVI